MKTLDQNVEELYRDQQPLHLILLNLSETVSKYKIKKVGVLPIRIVKSNVSSVGLSSESFSLTCFTIRMPVHQPFYISICI